MLCYKSQMFPVIYVVSMDFTHKLYVNNDVLVKNSYE